MAISEPKIVDRAAMPYAAIHVQVNLQELSTIVPPMIGEVFTVLARQGIEPAGAPFFRYYRVDMEANIFELDVGVPTKGVIFAEGRTIATAMPSGKYALVINTGAYDQLMNAHGALHAWIEEHQLKIQYGADGKRWGAMVEWYLTDPTAEPHSEKWETEISYLLVE